MAEPVQWTDVRYQCVLEKDGKQMTVGPRHGSFYELARKKYPELLKPMTDTGWRIFWREHTETKKIKEVR